MGFRKLGEPFQTLGGGGLGKSPGKGFKWNQFATFEAGAITPYPTGADVAAGVVANLAVNAAAAIRGSFGLQVTTVGAGSDSFVQFTDPTDETKIVIDLLFDPNSIVMGAADRFTWVQAPGSGPGGAAFLVNYRVVAGIQVFQSLCRDDAGGNVTLPNITALDEAMQIRIEWMASTAVGADDGYMRVYLNGELAASADFVDNDQHDVDMITVGAVGVDAGTTGPMFFDNIRWNNQM